MKDRDPFEVMDVPPPKGKAVAAIEHVLERRMKRFGLLTVKVLPGRDHDGDPVLFIDAYYDPQGRPIESDATFGLLRELRDALRKVGETRFPHIRHHFPDDQKVVPAS